jgi:hypothetical protein
MVFASEPKVIFRGGALLSSSLRFHNSNSIWLSASGILRGRGISSPSNAHSQGQIGTEGENYFSREVCSGFRSGQYAKAPEEPKFLGRFVLLPTSRSSR